MAWSWTGGASEWIIPLPNVPIPPHPEFTWDDQLSKINTSVRSVSLTYCVALNIDHMVEVISVLELIVPSFSEYIRDF